MTEETKTHALEKNREDVSFSEFFYPLIFPFKIKHWWKRMWALPIMAYIPIVDFILLRGWRLELVRRMARKEENALPPVHAPRHHIKFFKNGIILWLMTGLYVGVPFVIIFSTGTGLWGGLFELTQWVYQSLFSSEPVPPLSEILSENTRNALIRLGIEGVWLILSAPLYRAGMIRFAFTNSMLSFFNVISNVRFIFRQRNLFLKTYLFSMLFKILSFVVTFLLTMTGIGIAFIPLVVLIVYYYSTGYEYGHLAQGVKSSSYVWKKKSKQLV